MLTRQREFLQWIFGGVSTSALIVGGVWVTDHRTDLMAEAGFGLQATTSASLADDHSEKAEDLKKHSVPGTSQKASGDLLIELTSANGRQSDGSLALTAKVIATSSMTGLSYDWVLPDGVALISGSQHGDIGTLAEGAASALDIAVSTSATQNAHVLLHVYRIVAGEKLGHVVHYNTLDQDSIQAKLASKRSEITGALARDPASVTFGRRAE